MRRILKIFLIVCALSLHISAEKNNVKTKQTINTKPQTYRRVLPADVLRDFPDACFAAIKGATVLPGESWDLTPFCGRSTCVKTENPKNNNTYYFTEVVEDCGPQPKANPKCRLSDKTKKDAPFPECCPIFECEPGAKLEYPQVPTVSKI